ncbi:AAA family ATPase [Kitasatospora sp. NPDC028055]|uniref:AAA family ATPase n=1 Tax=Kitasatospora sp. NPDC028055 TaxID=3155653 RepID=UPI0033C28D6A
MLTAARRASLPPDRRADYDLFRRLTNVNLPLQQTPMSAKVARLINRRLNGNALKQDDPRLSGIMISAAGNHGKTATVCSVTAAFEDTWLNLHQYLNPNAVEGTLDLHAPVVYVQTPVTASPKSLCHAILNFFGPPARSLTLPQLIRQVAASLHDHGVRALILGDINRLRMHRADDQDVLDLIRSLMSFQVTLVLTGVNIPGMGLLRQAKWDTGKRQWILPPLETTRVHGLEVTQTERRFEMVELDRFHYSTAAQIEAFTDHLRGIEVHLRLMKAKPGMLTAGTMPEYLFRPTSPRSPQPSPSSSRTCSTALDPAADPAASSEFFDNLSVLAAIISAAWPNLPELPAPAELLDAFNAHAEEQSALLPYGQRTPGRRSPTGWRALPNSAPATAALLAIATHCLHLPGPDLKKQLAELLGHVPGRHHADWGGIFDWTKTAHRSTSLRFEIHDALAGHFPPR